MQAPVVGSRRAGAVFVVTALGTFMASLDLSIVNVAFPDIEASYRDCELGVAGVDHHRLLHRVRRAARRRRAHRRPARPQTGLPRRHRRVPARLVPLRDRTRTSSPWSRPAPCKVSARRSWCRLRSPCSSAPTHRNGACRSSPSGAASGRSRWPPVRRSARRSCRPAAGDGRSSSTSRSACSCCSFGRRVLTESVGDTDPKTPDFVGVGLMSLALASLVLAISEGSTWGWTDGRILAAVAVAFVAGAVFVHRTLHHDDPVIDPDAVPQPLVRDRQHRDRRLRQRVLRHAARQHPVPHRGVELLDHAGRSRRDARAGRRGDHRRASRQVGGAPRVPSGAPGRRRVLRHRSRQRTSLRVTTTPDYLAHWLPGTLLVGVGIGLTFPVLSAGAVSSLPPARFAVGSAVNQTARQIGGALGIAVLVALIGSQRQLADPIDGFHQLWAFAAAAATPLRCHRIVHPPPAAPVGDRRRPVGRRPARGRGRPLRSRRWR